MSSLITFGLAVLSVGLWTLRVALAARGSRGLGSAVAAIEAMTFVVAFSHVTGSLDAPVQLVVYGFGVGLGTFVGVSADRLIRARWPIQAEGSRRVPGSNRHSPAGVSRAHETSPGEG